MYAPFVAVTIIYSSIYVPCKLFKYGAWPVRGKREAPCGKVDLIANVATEAQLLENDNRNDAITSTIGASASSASSEGNIAYISPYGRQKEGFFVLFSYFSINRASKPRR